MPKSTGTTNVIGAVVEKRRNEFHQFETVDNHAEEDCNATKREFVRFSLNRKPEQRNKFQLHNNPSENTQCSLVDAKSDTQSIVGLQECELCGQKVDLEMKVNINDLRLCEVCHHQIKRMPEMVAKGVVRFLIGNVV